MRRSGILLHISSLPSPGGIGSLGQEAYEFVDFLQAAGMSIWQVLPVGPTGYGDSPYQSSSVFAGNPLLISCRRLREEGLLSYEDGEEFVPDDPEKVDYERVKVNKDHLLRRCFAQSADRLSKQLEDFEKEQTWVSDFALFTAAHLHFGNQMWTRWPDEGLRMRRKEALEKYRKLLSKEIRFQIFCQYLFRRQWADLRKYCASHGVSLFGDMPIYVAEDSADTWTHPEVFRLDRNRVPKRVAGVPPDLFSADGQLWGNPLYRWNRLRWRRFSWWVERMRGMASLYDIIRIDHFIGFANYWSIPYGAPNARQGKWIKAPGKALFKRLKTDVPDIQIIAEDLGEVSPRVKKLLSFCGFPGMKVLSFGFDGDESNPHFPANYSENCVAYTGTHDNDTVLGWAEKASPEALRFAMDTLGFTTVQEAPEAFIQALFRLPCEIVIVPMQDILGLDGSARMNFPSTIGGNWVWRMKPGVLTQELSMKYYLLNRQTDRR